MKEMSYPNLFRGRNNNCKNLGNKKEINKNNKNDNRKEGIKKNVEKSIA